MPKKHATGRLEEDAIDSAAPRDGEYQLSDGAGLALVVEPSGRKRWLYRYSFAQARRKLWLGSLPQVGLNKARELRAAAAGLLAAGTDPGIQRIKDRAEVRLAAGTSFEEVARQWWKARKAKWSTDHADRILHSLEMDIFPRLGRLPVAEVTGPLLLDAVERVINRGAHETGSRLLQRCGRILTFALARGLITTNPSIGLSEGLSAQPVKNQPAMPETDLPEFFARLSTTPLHARTRIGLELLARLAPRPSELRFAKWPEFDLDDKRLWRVPAARMKLRVEHLCPLPDQVITLLKELRKFSGGDFLFPSESDTADVMSENTTNIGLHRMGFKNRHVSHGFRALFSTIANEAGKNADHVEAQLAHRPRNAIRAIYNRSLYLDQRRELLQWYSDRLDQHKSAAPAWLAERGQVEDA